MKDSPDWTAAAPAYPRAKSFVDPVGERVQVYDRPFRISENITLTLTPSMRQRAMARESLVVAAALEYQACDESSATGRRRFLCSGGSRSRLSNPDIDLHVIGSPHPRGSDSLPLQMKACITVGHHAQRAAR